MDNMRLILSEYCSITGRPAATITVDEFVKLGQFALEHAPVSPRTESTGCGSSANCGSSDVCQSQNTMQSARIETPSDENRNNENRNEDVARLASEPRAIDVRQLQGNEVVGPGSSNLLSCKEQEVGAVSKSKSDNSKSESKKSSALAMLKSISG